MLFSLLLAYSAMLALFIVFVLWYWSVNDCLNLPVVEPPSWDLALILLNAAPKNTRHVLQYKRFRTFSIKR